MHVLAQPMLLRRPKAPTNGVLDSASRSCRRNVVASEDNNENLVPCGRLYDSSMQPRIHDGEKVPRHLNSLHETGMSKGNLAKKQTSLVYQQNSSGTGHLPTTLWQQKSHYQDLHRFNHQPKFTLRDFNVHFSTSEAVPFDVVEKSLYSPFTYCRLQKILQDNQPRNTQLSRQQLQLPEDLHEVCQRVPRQQLLIEMTAVLRKRLSKVIWYRITPGVSGLLHLHCPPTTLEDNASVVNKDLTFKARPRPRT